MDCLFCKISERQINTDIVYEDNKLVAFHDINPQAPTHVLIIPRKHIATINDITVEDTVLIGEMVQKAREIAHEMGISTSGYRILFNINQHGGQAVYHIHLHLLGGRQMSWPPG